MSVPDIFDRNARRTQRGRTPGGGFFAETMAADLFERLDAVTRPFDGALVIGAEPDVITGLARREIAVTVTDPSARRAARAMDEDRLDLGGRQFDLVMAVGTLDTVADLPGALLLMRRALRPGGLMLAACAGAPSLVMLRQAVTAADAAEARAVARLHPQIDVRAAGDLLVRAGFSDAVADLVTLDVAYRSFGALIADLRAAGATNVLQRRHDVTRRWLRAAEAAFSAAGGKGRTHETLSFIVMTGWAAP